LIQVKSMQDFENSLLTKLRFWEIEKEWRMIADKKKLSFNKKCLIEITLGINVPDSTFKWFDTFCENVYYHAITTKLKVMEGRLVKVDKYGDIITENEIQSLQQKRFVQQTESYEL